MLNISYSMLRSLSAYASNRLKIIAWVLAINLTSRTNRFHALVAGDFSRLFFSPTVLPIQSHVGIRGIETQITLAISRIYFFYTRTINSPDTADFTDFMYNTNTTITFFTLKIDTL